MKGPTIQIGRTALVRSANLPLENLSEEGYIIAPARKAILISGRTDDGTVSGVYGFLRDNLGVRWFMPGELWEVLPKADPLTVKVRRVTANPDFADRIWGIVKTPEGNRWLARNRLSRYRTTIPNYGFGHNLMTIYPPSKYGKEHPEYYAEINGKRVVPEIDGKQTSEPCFTNPDVIRIAAETARAYFDKNPQATQYSLCVNDNLEFCTCRNCSKLDSPIRVHRSAQQYSESYFYFVDQVAKEVARTHPDKTLGCYAYWAVELPPRNIERLPDNVSILLTQDTSQQFDPEYLNLDREIYTEWNRKVKHLGKYDYYGLGWISPRYFPHLAAEDIRFLHDQGAAGFNCEAYPYWIITSPQLYMAAQLLWDADQDPEALLSEYFNSLYGQSAPEMKKFYDGLERIWTKKRRGQWFQGLDWIDNELKNFDAPAMKEARACLDRAIDGSKGLVRQRIEYVYNGFQFSYQMVLGYDAALSLRSLPLEQFSDIETIRDEMKRVLDMAITTRWTYETNIKPDPLYQMSYYQDGERFWRKFDGWEERLSNAVAEQAVRLRNWIEKHRDVRDLDQYNHEIEELFTSARLRRSVDLSEALAAPTEIHKAPANIKMDGRLEDWKDIPYRALTPGAATPAASVLAKAALCWDETNLYIACVAQNPTHLQELTGADIWNQDSLQLAIDPLRNAWQIHGLDKDDREYGFALTRTGPIVWCWRGNPAEGLENNISIMREEDLTVYEAALPWSEIGIEPSEQIMSLSILLNNDDGQGRTTLTWGSGVEVGKDPRLFKPIRLTIR